MSSNWVKILTDYVNEVESLLKNVDYGLSALKTLIEAVPTTPELEASALTRYTTLTKYEVEIGFPSTPQNDTLAVDGDLTEEAIVVSLPEGSTVQRASLLCILEAIQDSTTAQVINVDVKLKKGGGDYATVLSLSPCLHLPVYEGTTSEIVMPVDVSAVVDEGATYTAKMTIDQVAASVKYISAYVIVVAYTMG